ncbi:hypothetical protein H310_14574 [Aphanomyces invadans]|uniref:Uncharacterized protein n=1 Tax=Aphanomyces invadans TaxID=157072 RepID=A0A024T949_9STRA|nr:hypothetical protein H310_14574 [Aphanomyces invadans]ETV90680.1 hypothetical protein H310_14574 [Aphanomyces invadans]|eukprot:XP_008880677.1 hypothetical protein H310_14574 [Aphanomyces invadans]
MCKHLLSAVEELVPKQLVAAGRVQHLKRRSLISWVRYVQAFSRGHAQPVHVLEGLSIADMLGHAVHACPPCSIGLQRQSRGLPRHLVGNRRALAHPPVLRFRQRSRAAPLAPWSMHG